VGDWSLRRERYGYAPPPQAVPAVSTRIELRAESLSPSTSPTRSASTTPRDKDWSNTSDPLSRHRRRPHARRPRIAVWPSRGSAAVWRRAWRFLQHDDRPVQRKARWIGELPTKSVEPKSSRAGDFATTTSRELRSRSVECSSPSCRRIPSLAAPRTSGERRSESRRSARRRR